MKFEDILPGHLFEIKDGDSRFLCLRGNGDDYCDIESYYHLDGEDLWHSVLHFHDDMFEEVMLRYELIADHGKVMHIRNPSNLEELEKYAEDLDNGMI